MVTRLLKKSATNAVKTWFFEKSALIFAVFKTRKQEFSLREDIESKKFNFCIKKF